MQQDEDIMPDAPAVAQPSTETAIDTKVTMSTAPDPNPAGPTPIEDITSGIQPIADFIPKDASNLSHPTPPPDEPLITGAADIDMEMGDSGAQPSEEPQHETAQSEPSLIRPREDDGEDEPAAKRSRVDDESQADMEALKADVDAPAASINESMADEPVEEVTAPAVDTVADSSVEPAIESVAEPMAESTEESVVEPSSSDVKVETSQVDAQLSDAPAEPVEGAEPAAPIIESPMEEKPSVPEVSAETQPPSDAATAPTAKPTYSTEPMTKAQKSSLVDKTKNLKKTKNSVAFLKPVDYVTLNIPNYPEVIKNPMDLGTMEAKLKDDQYASVQDFANDFDLIISNVRRFNGDAHAVTQAGFAMEAYFRKMMEAVPSADVVEQPKVQRKRSTSIPREKPPRRESRAAAAPTPAPAPAPASAPAAAAPPGETYALQADGTPQIRRQSSNRPARAIKPPQNREIPYAKPKRKEHQLELKFCEHVLKEMRSTKYNHLNHVFLLPVDPVALNIPHYHQVVKNPMDLSTMGDKLKQGQYSTAVEFKKDFDLMIKNCLTFNPTGNPVRDLGIQFQRELETLWSSKTKWERQNQPASNRASSASGDDESGADEEDEEEEDAKDDKTATIRALQKQLADMQNAVSAMAGEKTAKPKKAKGSKAKKDSHPSVPTKSKAAAKPAPKAKKPKQVTYDEKQEISEAVARMDDKQVQRLTEIITQNCAKYRDMEEMELEIDDLPNDVQVMLLDYVRKIFGNPKKKVREPSPDDAAALDDDDFEPAERGARGGKRKKHRPMGKKEQQDAINNIKSKLAQFSQPITSGSESPTASSFNAGNAQADTSGDDESEESEEE